MNAPAARIRFAQAVRQLASGTITNDEFDLKSVTREIRALGEVDAQAVDEIHQFAWSFYDDFKKHRLRGDHRLSPLQRHVFARCVLFLRSGLPYEWPANAKWLWVPQRKPVARYRLGDVLKLLLGRAEPDPRWVRQRDLEQKARQVDDRIWPFRTRRDYDNARSTLHLLKAA